MLITDNKVEIKVDDSVYSTFTKLACLTQPRAAC